MNHYWVLSTSLLARERGLKHDNPELLEVQSQSLLARERGLERRALYSIVDGFGSLLAQERGLKLPSHLLNVLRQRRSLHRSVD